MNNTLSEQAMPRAQHLTAAKEWLEWSANYRRKCLHPAKLERRFLIATYQPLQASHYSSGSPNFNEAMMASVLHYLMVYDELGCDPKLVEGLEKTPCTRNFSYTDQLSLENIRIMSQQINYFLPTRQQVYNRASRFNVGTARASLTQLMRFSLERVREPARAEACYNAMDIMCGKL